MFPGFRVKNAMFPKSLQDYGMRGNREDGAVEQEYEDSPHEDAQDAADDPSLYMQEMRRLYENPGPATAAYKQHLTQMPKAENYKPGVGTRLVAGMAGFASGLRDAGKGIETAQNMNTGNYRQAMGNYANEDAQMKNAAQLEDKDVDNKVRYMTQAQRAGLDYKKYLMGREKQDADIDLAGRKQDETGRHNRRMEDAAFQPKGSDYKYLPQADGGYIRTDLDGNSITIKGSSVEAARIKTQQRQAATGEKNAETQRIMGFGRLAHYNRTDDIAARRLNKPGNPSRPPSASQQGIAQDMVLDEMAKETRWKNFVGEPDARNGGRRDYVPETNDPYYKSFIKEMRKRVQQRLQGVIEQPEEEDNEFEDMTGRQ